MFEFDFNTIDALPRILVGPMVRKITTTSVSIFIVTKTEHDSRLELYDDAGNNVYTSDRFNPVQIGKNLYAHFIRVELREYNLKTNRLYYYDIRFSDEQKLASRGILNGGIREYVYTEYHHPFGEDIKPSFMVPPTHIDELRILHGSCRKISGSFIDALVNADTFLNQANLEERPHLLLHTGDQIYADDVSDVNLAIIRAIDKAIITDTNLQYCEDDEYINSLAQTPDTSWLNPGQRGTVVTEKGNLTAEKKHARSHLVRLGEFIGMYLLSWSDTFWGEDFMPTKAEVYEDPTSEPQERYDKEMAQFTIGREHQKAIKKVLANISSLMILDDHEITDDVFISDEWVNNVIGSSGSALGKQIVSNALIAYTLFQHIGNCNDDFSTFFAAIGAPPFLTTYPPNVIKPEIKPLVLPNIVTNGDITTLTTASGAINYHYKYRIEEADWEIIALNSRTNRSYTTTEIELPLPLPPNTKTITRRQLNLLSNDSITDQIKRDYDFTLKASIILSPTPIWGFERVELIQLFMKSIDAEGLNNYFDAESWTLNIPTREKLLNALLNRRYDFIYPVPSGGNHRVIVLCGDVHYGFAKKLSYVGNKSGTNPNEVYHSNLEIAQLCSSSFKNEDTKTKLVGRFKADDPSTYFGSINNGEPEPAFGGNLSNTYKYKVEQVKRRGETIASFLPTGTPTLDTSNFIKYHHFMQGRNEAIIGVNHIALVTFENWSTSSPKVIQESYWNRVEPTGSIRSLKYTYEIDMTFIDPSLITL